MCGESGGTVLCASRPLCSSPGRAGGRSSVGGGGRALEGRRHPHGGSMVTLSSLLDSMSPGHKGPVSDFFNVVPLFLRPTPSVSNSKSTSSEKPLGSELPHTRYYSLYCAFGLYVSLIFALNSSHFCTRWSLPVAGTLMEQRPCLRLCIFGCSLMMDVSHTCADGGGIRATARGPGSLWAASHFSLLPVLPLVTSSCVETSRMLFVLGMCNNMLHMLTTLVTTCEEQRSGRSHL